MECASFWKLRLLVIALVHHSRIHLPSEAAAGISVSLSVCARARVCALIPPHSAHPHQNKHLHQVPKMRTRLNVVAGGPTKPPQTLRGPYR